MKQEIITKVQRYIEKNSIITEPILTILGTSGKGFPYTLKEVAYALFKEEIIMK